MREVTDETFVDEVLRSELPVVVDFFAPWCKPCERIEPLLRELAEEWRGRVGFTRLNIEESLGTPGRLGVLSIPTVILFAGGEERARVVGAQPRSRYVEAFSSWL
ncbi:MAG: thioredoxin [Gaiellaceae bacterium]|nr:MAG: thioredoxin [Gaiellaceae bacterium]